VGLLLPTDENELKQTDLWRVIYGYIPLGLMLVYFIGLFTVIKYDSIQFLIVQDKYGDLNQYKAIKQVYKHANTS